MDKSAIIYAFLSAVLMATIGVFSKFTGMSPEMITFFRLFLGAVFMAVFLIIRREHKVIWRWPGISVIACGVCLAGFMSFYIQAMNYTSMANTIMLVYLAPFVAAVVAHFLLGERLTIVAVSLIALALLGFAMMMEFTIDVSKESRDFIGMCFGLLALICYAGFILVNRTIKKDVHVFASTFWQLFIGGVVVSPLVLRQLGDVHMSQVPWLAAIGFFPGFLAILCAVTALNRLPAALFGTIAYTEAVAVVIFGWTLFNEVLSSLQMAGCILIIISSILKTVVAEPQKAQVERGHTVKS